MPRFTRSPATAPPPRDAATVESIIEDGQRHNIASGVGPMDDETVDDVRKALRHEISFDEVIRRAQGRATVSASAAT